MKKFFLTVFFLLFALPAFSKVEVVTSYPYIQDIAEKIGQDKINASTLGSGNWDPHFVVPKPSLIARTRKADLLIINGAQLEIGWLPPIIQQANNPDIQPGYKGFLDLSNFVNLIQVPTNISRGQGDVHPSGNPHFHLDPHNIPLISDAITNKLCQLDSSACNFYQKNNQDFKQKWDTKLKVWDKKLSALKGINVIEYHRVYDYLFSRYGLNIVNTIEPLPGIVPTPKHLVQLINQARKSNIKYILKAVYNPKEQSVFVAEKSKIKLIVLPHDIGSVSEAKDIFSLFDEIVKRLD